MLRFCLKPPKQLITDELAFQLVSVGTRYDGNPFFIAGRVKGHDPVFADIKMLRHRKFD